MIEAGNLVGLCDEFEVAGGFYEFAEPVCRQACDPVRIGNTVTRSFGSRPGHVIGTLAIAMEKPARCDMRAGKVISGRAKPAGVGFLVDVARRLRQLPPVGHPSHLPDNGPGGFSGRPVAAVLDNRRRRIGRIEFSAGPFGRTVVPRFAGQGKLVDAACIGMIRVGFHPAGKFNIA